MVFRIIRNSFRKRKAKKLQWVYIELDQEIIERPEPKRSFIQRKLFPPPKPSLKEYHEYFEQLAKIKNLKGIIVHIRTLPEGMAQIQSLRDMLEDFKGHNKKIVMFAQDYDFISYYFASVADKVFIQPGGMLSIMGLELSRVYLKDIFKKYGLEADTIPISPYKSSGDTFSRNDMSDEDREQRQAIIDSYFDTMVKYMISFNNKTKKDMVEIIDNAPYLGIKAQELGLIDGVVREEELLNLIQFLDNIEKKGKEPKIEVFDKSKKMIPLPKKGPKKNKIAIISAEGMIIPGHSKNQPMRSPVGMQKQVGDQTVVRKVRAALKNKRVKAVVLHVNSRGGSASASESMRSAMEELRKVKPLVVYFSDVSASGGYYISTASDYIIAQSLTLTGSIGVIMGKVALDVALKKQGINKAYVRKGENAGMFNAEGPFTDKQRKVMEDHLQEIYEQFVGHVAQVRKRTYEEIEPHCKGRVWSGEQALALGLVDEIGNIQTAIRKAASLANIKEGNYRVVDIYEAKCNSPMKKEVSNDLLTLFADFIKTIKSETIWFIETEMIKIE